jgi:hypothetical protein
MRMRTFAEDHGANMLIVAIILAGIVVFFMPACGSEKEADPYPEPRPPKPGPAGDAAWDELKPIVAANCGGCHNGSTHPLKFDSGAAFKRSKAKVRISNGSMPPTGALAPDVKAKMLAYLG